MPLDIEQWKGKIVEDIGSGIDWFLIEFTDGSRIEINPNRKPTLTINSKTK